jgi:hypothetical protein
MKSAYHLRSLPLAQKALIISFLIILSIGFFTGLGFVSNTTNANPKGIESQYLGNESDDGAVMEMKFKKSKREMLTIIHTHTLSLALVFGIVGFLISLTTLPKRVKLFLIIEPFVSVFMTFGGLFVLWLGISWFSYIVAFSGFLMTITYLLSVFLIFFELLRK